MGATTLLSLEEFLNLPDAPGKRELLNGELISLPPANLSHNMVAKLLFELLSAVLSTKRVWSETAYQLSSGMLVPDVSVPWPDQRVENDYYQGSPMIAIEIASRGNSAHEIENKTAAYLQDGAAEVWIIYPQLRSMTVSYKDHAIRIAGTYHCQALGLDVDIASILAAPGEQRYK